MTFGLGTAADNIKSFAELGLTEPSDAPPPDYPKYIILANGAPFGQGSREQELRSSYITLSELAVYRTYCSGSSAMVYLRTLKENGNFAVYTAQMEMTVPRGNQTMNILEDFVIKFTKMVEVTTP